MGKVDRILQKLTSGRFICLLVMVTSYAWLVHKGLNLYIEGAINENLVTILVTGLVSHVGTIVAFYFLKKENGHE